MIAWIRQKFADIFNESKDVTALCSVRFGAYIALGVLVVKFAQQHELTPDMMKAFGEAAVMILASIVGKHYVENQ